MTRGWRTGLGVVVALVAAWAPASASAAVRAGLAEDPADAPGQVDVAAVEVRYDDAGSLALDVRFHEPVEQDAAASLEWSLLTDVACDEATPAMTGSIDLAERYAVVVLADPADAADVPAALTIDPDGFELHVEARAPALAGRDVRCARLVASDGDEVAPFALEPEQGVAPGAPPPAGTGPGSAPGEARPGLRLTGPRLVLRRRGTAVVAQVRPTVCTRRGTRLRFVVTERRRRLGTGAGAVLRRHHFARTQPAQCARHRLRWRFSARRDAAYVVAASVLVAAPRGRAAGAGPRVWATAGSSR